MDAQSLLLPLLNGLSHGALLFVAAAGLTLAFGVLKVVNFAHGHFLMLAAYLLFQVSGGAQTGPVQLAFLILVVSLISAALGAAVEVGVIRRVYGSGELFMVLATYAILLIIQGGIEQIWGNNPVSVPLPRALAGGVSVAGVIVPVYSLVLVVVGALVAAGMAALLRGTSIGRVVRAAAEDRQMTEALGVNVPLLYTSVFAVAALLAGLAGGLAGANVALNLDMGVNFVIQAFAVVVVGGIGSVPGALLGAVMLGILDSVLGRYIPVLTGITFYLAMAAVLIVRPQGLLGTRVARSW